MQNGYCYHLLKRRKLLLSFARPHFRPYSKASDHRHLRILYCGSDEFSAISLRALNEYRTRSHQVQHIDVVCKAGKPTGRGLKHIRDGKYLKRWRAARLIPFFSPLEICCPRAESSLSRDLYLHWMDAADAAGPDHCCLIRPQSASSPLERGCLWGPESPSILTA